MNVFNPDPYLLKIQKQKYKIAIYPILIVVVAFILHSSFQFIFLKYTSLAGLLGYIFVIMLHKVNKAVPPSCETSCILSPISGKITSIDDRSIGINKSIFDPIDVRCASTDGKIIPIWKDRKPKFFEENCRLPGKLIGMIAGKANCIFDIPDKYKIEVVIGEKIIAGETILAKISVD